MRILLTNDDGYDAPGIMALYDALHPKHDLTLVAPDREKSAVGHGIGLNCPLRITQIKTSCGHDGFAVNGTPADCVKLALFELCEKPPHVVIAGINPGSNTGVNINYSGTAAAAREAVFNGIFGMAVSLEIRQKKCLDFKGMADFIDALIPKIGQFDLPAGTFLNINGPDNHIENCRGVKFTHQAENNVSKNFIKKTDPRGRSYFWYGPASHPKPGKNSDTHALSDNYISISPLQCNTTHTLALTGLKQLEPKL